MRLNVKLKNKKSCEDCPCNYVDMVHVDDDSQPSGKRLRECVWGCTLDYYIGVVLKPNSIKRRPERCVAENGL